MEAKAAAAHSALAALISLGSSALCYSHTAQAARVAPKPGGQDDAAGVYASLLWVSCSEA